MMDEYSVGQHRSHSHQLSMTSLLQLNVHSINADGNPHDVILGEYFGYYRYSGSLYSARLGENSSRRLIDDVVAFCSISSDRHGDNLLILNTLGNIVEVAIVDGTDITSLTELQLNNDVNELQSSIAVGNNSNHNSNSYNNISISNNSNNAVAVSTAWWGRNGGVLRDVRINFSSQLSLLTLKSPEVYKVYRIDRVVDSYQQSTVATTTAAKVASIRPATVPPVDDIDADSEDIRREDEVAIASKKANLLCTIESKEPLLSFWSNNSNNSNGSSSSNTESVQCLVVLAGSSSFLSVRRLQLQRTDREEEPLTTDALTNVVADDVAATGTADKATSAANIAATSAASAEFLVRTRHRSWITALSPSESSETLHASGDASGKLILWQLRHNDNNNNNRNSSNNRNNNYNNNNSNNNNNNNKNNNISAEVRSPLRYLLGDIHVCRSHRIDCIRFQRDDCCVWIGDASGAITCAVYQLQQQQQRQHHQQQHHRRVRRSSIFAVRRFRFFDCGARFESLHWTAAPSALPDEFRLRCYSRSHAAAAQLICSSAAVESAFRVWSEPTTTSKTTAAVATATTSNAFTSNIASTKLYNDVAAGVDTSGATAPFAAAVAGVAVEVCCLLPQQGLLLTAGRSKTICVWDVYVGNLLHSVGLEDDFCKSIAAVSMVGDDSGMIHSSNSSITRVVVGHSNGYFTALHLCDTQQQQQHQQQQTTDTTDSAVAAAAAAVDAAVTGRFGHAGDVDIFDVLAVPHSPQPSLIQQLQQQSKPAVALANAATAAVAAHTNRSSSLDPVDYDYNDAATAADNDDSNNDNSDSDNSDVQSLQSNPALLLQSDSNDSPTSAVRFFLPSQPRITATTAAAAGGDYLQPRFNHRIEHRASVSRVPISDVFISQRGNFVAVCYLRKLLVTYNVNAATTTATAAVVGNNYQLAAKIRFADRCIDIRPLQIAIEQSNNAVINTTTATTAAAVVNDVLLLLVAFSAANVKVVDAVSGNVLCAFAPLPQQQLQSNATFATNVAAAAAFGNNLAMLGGWCQWDDLILTQLQQQQQQQQQSWSSLCVHGICVSDNFHIGLFDSSSGVRKLVPLHNQQQQLLALKISSNNSSYCYHNSSSRTITAPVVSTQQQQQQLLQARLFSELDNLPLGISLPDFASTAPVAVLWSMRRLVLLRIEKQQQQQQQQEEYVAAGATEADRNTNGSATAATTTAVAGLRVLRRDEFHVGGGGVRVVFASPLPLLRNAPQHRLIVVFSDGAAMILHL